MPKSLLPENLIACTPCIEHISRFIVLCFVVAKELEFESNVIGEGACSRQARSHGVEWRGVAAAQGWREGWLPMQDEWRAVCAVESYVKSRCGPPAPSGDT